MSYETFITNNIRNELIKLGYPESVANQSCDRAIELYDKNWHSRASGKVFKDLLDIAKEWAKKLHKIK